MKKRTVYLVDHLRILNGADEIKTIGIYSTQPKARAAVKRTCRLPGFRRHPRGFSIDPYTLDEDHWTSGFFTTRPGGRQRRSARKKTKASAKRQRKVAR